MAKTFLETKEFIGEIQFTPQDVAELFCSLDDRGMAEFFTEIDNITSKWTPGGFPIQMQYVKESEYATFEGKYIMSKIGEYSE